MTAADKWILTGAFFVPLLVHLSVWFAAQVAFVKQHAQVDADMNLMWLWGGILVSLTVAGWGFAAWAEWMMGVS